MAGDPGRNRKGCGEVQVPGTMLAHPRLPTACIALLAAMATAVAPAARLAAAPPPSSALPSSALPASALPASALPASALPASALPSSTRADFVLVEKALRRLTLYSGGSVLKTYGIALGFDPIGPKVRQGDGRTPEGAYVIDWRNARSRFHRSLHISYPNREDRQRARALGVPPGGDIMIHGLPREYAASGGFHRLSDWTLGCIAVTNEEIEEIWRAVPDGTPIEIRP